MRSFAEIYAEIQTATAQNDVDALTRLANEMDGIETTIADAVRSKARGLVRWQLGDLHGAIEQYRRALAAYERDEHPLGIAVTLDDLGVVYLALSELPEALAAFMRALEIFQEIDDVIGIGDTLGDLGKLYQESGNYPEALDYCNRGLEAYERLGDPSYSAWMLANIGTLYSEINEHDKALEFMERAQAVTAQLGNPNLEARQLGNKGLMYAAMGDPQRAVECCRRSVAMMREVGHQPEVFTHLTMLCTALTAAQDTLEARAVLNELEAMEAASPLLELQRDSCAGAVAALEGDLEAAHGRYLNALDAAQRSGLQPIELQLHQHLRDLAQKRADFEGYIHHNTEFQRINEEIHGKGAVQRIALADAERQMRAERQEREKERAVLYSTLPKVVADRVIRGETVEDHFEQASVLFADIVGFTTHTSSMHPSDTIRLLEDLYQHFDAICAEHGVVKVKTIGDSYLCFAGSDIGDRISDISQEQRAASSEQRVAAVALVMQHAEFYWPSATANSNSNSNRIQLRIGIHSGPVSAGVIGTQRLQYDIWGDTVNVASRMESTGEPGRIQVSESFAEGLRAKGEGHDHTAADASLALRTHTLALRPYTLAPRGEVNIKGKGTMKTYWLE